MFESEGVRAVSKALITLVLPYYNEAEFIVATLTSLAKQTDRRFELTLVNNASTDESEALARDACTAMPDIKVSFLSEAEPGKIFALRTGIAAASTRYVATLDADTIYPPDYVARTLSGFSDRAGVAAVLAFDRLAREPEKASAKQKLFADYLPRKCHTGGFGQAFDAILLAESGGFDPQKWPYVLEDHEIVHRIGKLGDLVYPDGHVCYPSDRRSDRSDCSWTLSERIFYKLMPQAGMDWFFYRFLAGRFEARGLRNVKLRDQSRQPDQAPVA